MQRKPTFLVRANRLPKNLKADAKIQGKSQKADFASTNQHEGLCSRHLSARHTLHKLLGNS
jgi:hypothetical protein